MDNLFVMDPHEIEYAYRHATNKRQQISILADLNGCSNQKIIDFLKERGIEVEKRPYTKHTVKTQQSAAETQQDEPLPLGTPFPRKEKESEPEELESHIALTEVKEPIITPRTLDISADEAHILRTVLEHTAARCSQEIFRIKREINEKEEALSEQETLSRQLSALLGKFGVVSDVR